MLIVDTDVLIWYLRGNDKSYKTIENLEIFSISVITYMELVQGMRNKKELNLLEDFLNRFQVIKLNEFISDKAAMLLKNYRLSHGLLIADSLIAATAIIEEVPLISKNQRDYRFIEEVN